MIKYISKNNLSKYTEILKEKLGEKINEPLIDGIEGDVLTIDEDGNRIWKTFSFSIEGCDESEILDIFHPGLFLEEEDWMLFEDNTYILLEN